MTLFNENISANTWGDTLLTIETINQFFGSDITAIFPSFDQNSMDLSVNDFFDKRKETSVLFPIVILQ